MNATTSKSRRNGPSLSAPFRQALNEWDCVGLSVSPDTRSYPGNVQLIFQSPGMSLIDPEQRADRSGISAPAGDQRGDRSEEHTSELQSLMRISYAVFCLKKKRHRRYDVKRFT